MIREGARVSYTGPQGHDNLLIGDQGRVLTTDPTSGGCNVLWSTGARQHQITDIYEYDLVVTGSHSRDGLEDSLDVGTLTVFSARNAYDIGGGDAVVNQMAEGGHLASFAAYAEEVLTLVSARVRQDPSFRAVTADLDEEEAEQVFRTASAALLRDAFLAEESPDV